MYQLRVVSRSSTMLFLFMYFTSSLPSSQASQKNPQINKCFAAGWVKSSPSYDQSVLNLSLVASCLHSLLALQCLLCFCSHRGAFIVRIAQLFHYVKVSLNFCILFDVHNRCKKLSVSGSGSVSVSVSVSDSDSGSVSVSVSFIFIFISDVRSIQVVECGFHGQ